VLPKPSVVQEYTGSVPDDFLFCIKVPNSITLTHYYKLKKTGTLIPNPHYLSIDLMHRFLERLETMSKNIGPLIFQFEYLNKQKMPGGMNQFIDRFGEFMEQMPKGFQYCVESRNPNFLKDDYFSFPSASDLHHVFLQGYYMPSIFDLYTKHKGQIKDIAVIRLHGPDRKGIEKKTGKSWSQIVAPKDKDIESLVDMLTDLNSLGIESFVYVNNHFEGSAPKTIQKVVDRLPF
jgi:uncharacterized protein YecE (DUF72 family)